ncbi:hypothetical protein [Microbulbifer litoralis]|uniref:hypothetical protein n=1 Tax=Microbulbifer litoralis TaxID=2933965 RepID=UPI0020276E59|nr:hypothetical protein [Microbulbifer sp. GX H0434]
MVSGFNYPDFIERLENATYGKKGGRPLKAEDVESFVDFYMAADQDYRGIISDLIQDKMGLTLISFSGEFSAKAIDTRDDAWVVKAVMLHVIEGFRFDYRENIRRLVFISYAADRISSEIESILKNLSKFIDGSVEEKLLEFFRRPKELNSLKIYGMKEVSINGKVRFRPN